MKPSKQTLLKICFPLLACALVLICIFACFFYLKGRSGAPVSPFSAASWDASPDESASLEGSAAVTYDSVYGGICYTYPHTYENLPGTIKYMFDDKEQLLCIAWTYTSDNEEELYDIYRSIEESVEAQTAKEAQTTDKTSNTGHVWYRKDGNIIVSLMITSNLKALQYSFLHPDISSPPQE